METLKGTKIHCNLKRGSQVENKTFKVELNLNIMHLKKTKYKLLNMLKTK